MLACPRKSRQYAMTTDASIGDDDHPGGLGAILTQIDEDGNHLAIGYASRKLTDFEKNYTPCLLEMQGALWGIEHFQYYLKGRPFLLFTDHKPLVGLGKVHKRTHARLRLAMLDYNFQLIYKKATKCWPITSPAMCSQPSAFPTKRWRTYRTGTKASSGS